MSRLLKEDHSHFNQVVFLPGWGFKGEIIKLLEPAGNWLYPDSFLDPFSFEKDLLAFFERQSISKAVLVGWSMGGYLALDFAKKYPQRVKALHLLSLRKSWPVNEVDVMRTKLLQNPTATLQEFYRRCFLGHKPQYHAFVSTMQDALLRAAPLDILLTGLDYLQQIEIDTLPEADIWLYHGKKDIVAPLEEACPSTGLPMNVYANAGHMVFFTPEFDLTVNEKKRILQKKFSAAAASYDDHAQVQKNIVARLTQKLPAADRVRSILEIGCGTGNYTHKLAEKYPRQKITALDFSEGMITKAKQKHAACTNVTFLCLDAEHYLARISETFDLITSNATLQWFDDLPGAFVRAEKLLAGGGKILASVFGSKSMHQLHKAFQELFGYEDLPVHAFPTYEDLAISLHHYAKVEIEEIEINRQYDSFRSFLENMKKTGAGGWHTVQPPLLTRNRLAKLDSWFADNYGGYTITYQVFLIYAEKEGSQI